MSDLHIQCPHFDICSGCTRNEYVDHLPMLDDANHFFAENGAPFFKMQTGSATGWRCRAKLAVRGTVAAPLIGLFAKGTHQTINIPQCRVHHPAINRAMEILRKWIMQYKIEPYDEVAATGLLRYVQASVERKSGHIQLVIIINAKNVDDEARHHLEALWQAVPDLWHSIWLNLNTRRDNIIFGNEWIHIKGSFWLWETLNRQQICLHPASFMQANLEMFDRLLQRIEHLLPEDADLLEFYAGVGAIGASVVEKCQKVQCIELNQTAQKCFEETCRALSPNLAKRLSYLQGKSADHINLLNFMLVGKGVVLVDPPRKGLEKELLKALCENKCVNNIIYVSCGWAAFQGDCQSLLKAGWHIAHAEAFLFFPGSDHIEILAAFERRI
ncbi:MAG: class I SAM-dependent RNA methyltransferase [Parachlamydiaceae bacterium]|nr:class I SAM-dependent RNA methyltransferase [Parachlamydiaceae bacterium]